MTNIDNDTRQLLARVARVVEPYMDGLVVTDYGIGNVEYGNDHEVWVLGNWNPTGPNRWDNPTRDENLGPRLADALEWLGAEVHWLDEWTRCGDCHRIFRTEPDSAFWRMSGAITDNGEAVCKSCLLEDMDRALDELGVVNDYTRCVTFADRADMVAAGWEAWGEVEQTGLHRGMDAKPKDTFNAIRRETDADIVFLLDDNSQFYVEWSAWTRRAYVEWSGWTRADCDYAGCLNRSQDDERPFCREHHPTDQSGSITGTLATVGMALAFAIVLVVGMASAFVADVLALVVGS